MELMQADTQRPAGLSSGNPSSAMHGFVVMYPCKPSHDPGGHESMTHAGVARKLAALKGYEFAGTFDASYSYGAPLYFVPNDTLVPCASVNRLNIQGEHDLFGGVVPFPFATTKTITHALADGESVAPEGWSPEFGERVRGVVLPGYSAFSARDARIAALRLLERGAVRLKRACGIGGLGQSVVRDREQLEAELESLDPEELLRDGIVCEQNLSDIVTYSAGQVRVGELLATYYGTQQLTTNNKGEEVYGGSELTVVPGDFEALLRLDLADDVRSAITQARVYHASAKSCFRGMFASRCNYDIAQGVDDNGQRISGVLEQSWRIGGASAAEIAALEAFRADPSLKLVRASTTEIYGEPPSLPRDAVVYFCGTDARVGPLTKYARLEIL